MTSPAPPPPSPSPSRGQLVILYGSETGTAEECAHSLRRESKRRGFEAFVTSLDSWRRSELVSESANCVFVFVVSTTGQGAEPRNMTRFWKWLLRKSLDGLFGGRSVAVFGLGDSAYPKFNYPAKKLFKRLIQLGATPLLGRGDGDDQHPLGLDGAFDPWCNKLWEALDARFPVPPNFTILPKNILPPPTYSIQFLTTSDIPQTTTPPTLYTAKCIQNTRITHPAHFQDVRHMVFDLSNTSANPPTYSPADVMTIYPSNSASDVQEALDFFEWSDIADTPFHLLSSTSTTTTTTNTLPFPQTLTLRQTLTHHLNLFGRPTSRHFFHLLSFFTTDVMHAEKLQEFASSEGHEEVFAYCHKLRRTVFEVIQDFHSCRGKIPPAYIFDLIAPLRPKQYSISSITPNAIDLTVGVVQYKTRMAKLREGVCTKYLASLEPGVSTVTYKIEKGTMSVPESVALPVVLIGAGTGIAPMRSLLLKRVEQGAVENVLFTGYRGRQWDYLYGGEFEQLESQEKLKLFNAFSREDANKVVYIQHRMAEQADLIWDVVQRGGYIYVSGNAQRIPKSVNGALVDIFKLKGGMSEEAALELLGKLEKERRYQSECWV